MCINGKFVYTEKYKFLKARCAKTASYLYIERRLDVPLAVKSPQWGAGADSSAHTSQLRSVVVLLSIIAYRIWNFGVMDVSMSFLKYRHLE